MLCWIFVMSVTKAVASVCTRPDGCLKNYTDDSMFVQVKHATARQHGGTGPFLRDMKFVTTHDAETGLIKPSLNNLLSAEDIVMQDYLKTQEVDLVGQLDCGARALDLRIGLESADATQVSMHHAQFFMAHSKIEEVVPPLISWADENPGELVIFLLSHCYIGSKHVDCSSNPVFFQAFSNLGIHVSTDPSHQNSMTVADAKSLAKLPGGGMILALGGTWIASNNFQNWPTTDCGSTVTLNGPEKRTSDDLSAICDALSKAFVNKSDCFGHDVVCDSSPVLTEPGCSAACWTQLKNYAQGKMQQFKGMQELFMTQCFFQETGPQILSFGAVPSMGVFQSGSYSILGVSGKSGLNRELKVLAETGFFDGANFIEVNQVNNQGPLIAKALGAKIKPNVCPQELWNQPLCEHNSDCSSGACARPMAGTNTLVCCPGSLDTYWGFDYCNGMPVGSQCFSNAMCASGWCKGGGTTIGKCMAPLPAGSSCSHNYQCSSEACGRGNADDASLECCGGGLEPYAGYDYCTGMSAGTSCWSDSMCADGHCAGNAGGLARGTCTNLLPAGWSCSTNSDCSSGACGRGNADDAQLTCCNGGLDLFAGYDYCTGMSAGTSCWTDAMCANGDCKGNWDGLERGTCN